MTSKEIPAEGHSPGTCVSLKPAKVPSGWEVNSGMAASPKSKNSDIWLFWSIIAELTKESSTERATCDNIAITLRSTRQEPGDQDDR
jgi:hypothetical protein